MKLSHSRMPFVRVYFWETQELVFGAHDKAFSSMAGSAGSLVDPTPLVPGARKDLLAFQKPSAPSPTARSGAISSPRCLMSMSSRQLCALSRTPVWKPTSSFLPSGVAPISTSMHSALSSIRACR
jgi:hypothetical protein